MLITLWDVKEPKHNSQKSRAWSSWCCGLSSVVWYNCEGKCSAILATPSYSKIRGQIGIFPTTWRQMHDKVVAVLFFDSILARHWSKTGQKNPTLKFSFTFTFGLSHHLQFRYFTFQIFHLPVVSLSWILHPRVYLKPCVTCQLPGADKFYR